MSKTKKILLTVLAIVVISILAWCFYKYIEDLGYRIEGWTWAYKNRSSEYWWVSFGAETLKEIIRDIIMLAFISVANIYMGIKTIFMWIKTKKGENE